MKTRWKKEQIRQIRWRWLWITLTTRRDGGLIIQEIVAWLCIGGKKPLARLPWWRRRLFHLPSIRWRLL